MRPPSSACAKTPASTTSAATFIGRRGAANQTASTEATARTTSTLVSVRLPNSMYLWKPSACSTVGVTEPSTHSGQVGQPSPLPVTRTSPPVTTIPTSATRLAIRMTDSQREPLRAAGGASGEVVLVLVTGQGYGRTRRWS